MDRLYGGVVLSSDRIRRFRFRAGISRNRICEALGADTDNPVLMPPCFFAVQVDGPLPSECDILAHQSGSLLTVVDRAAVIERVLEIADPIDEGGFSHGS